MPVPAGGSLGNAVGDPYATLEQIKAYMGLPDTIDDEIIESALDSVSREIEDICGRHFNRDETASTRVFEAASAGVVFVDDFYALEDLSLSVDDTVWESTSYRLYPRNGLVRGRPWPYTRIEAVSGYRFLTASYEQVSVTARWGWPEVPAPVHEACKIATAETVALKDARFGVAGFGQYGDIRVRANPMIMAKLAPYVLNPIKVA